jgi:hypothetical protein
VHERQRVSATAAQLCMSGSVMSATINTVVCVFSSTAVTAHATAAAATARQWFQDAFAVYAKGTTFPLLREVTMFLLDKYDGGTLVSRCAYLLLALFVTERILSQVSLMPYLTASAPLPLCVAVNAVLHAGTLQRNYDTSINDGITRPGFKKGFLDNRALLSTT